MRIETLNYSNNCQSHITENILFFHLFTFTHKVDRVEFDDIGLVVLSQGSAVT